MLLRKNKRIHFVGIGGIGMSGIAHILLEMGYRVSGSDLEQNSLTRKLQKMGGIIFTGHDSSNILKDTGLVVYSSSVSFINPEMHEARKRRIPIVHRAKLLAELFNNKIGIAVTGTHGKTTTTSLAAVMLENCGLNPTAIIGGEIEEFCGNAKLGKGKHIVAEADESDSSFLNLKPSVAVITNIEPEHLDHFKTMDDAKRAYRKFADNIKPGGILIYNHDDHSVRDALKGYKREKESFGSSRHADISPDNIKMDRFYTSFDCIYKGKDLGRVGINIPGQHNVMNALAAILVGLKSGLKFDDVREAIKDFKGVKRRFHLRSDHEGVMLIDDYGHHPTEIRVVLEACRNWKPRRLIAIFQPHRYTRTKALADDFGKCFKEADKLILTDIYAASEKPIRGVSVRSIYDRAKKSGNKDISIVKKEMIADSIMKIKKRGDMIVVFGAGDIKKVADELSEKLSGSFSVYNEKFLKEFTGSARGKIVFSEKLAPHTSFRIGGPADIWFEPRDARDLKKALLCLKRYKVPFFVIGNGSNILASDSGFRGVVINLDSYFFKRISINGTSVKVGAGYSLPKLVALCCKKNLSGMESLVGIPGTVGGSVYMNAGGWTNPIFKNIGELVTSVKVMDYSGRIKELKKESVVFGYRHSNLGLAIILEANFKLKKSDERLMPICAKFLKMKREKQVLDMPSAGCIFKNPANFQFTCGQMIDMLGLKGRRVGHAEIAQKHANFIINRGGATYSDVLELIGVIREKVKANYDVDLDLEVKVL